jgi:hypothetical protein
VDTYASTDANQRRQSALVEGQRAFIAVDFARGIERARVLLRRLQAHLDNVFCRRVSSVRPCLATRAFSDTTTYRMAGLRA